MKKTIWISILIFILALFGAFQIDLSPQEELVVVVGTSSATRPSFFSSDDLVVDLNFDEDLEDGTGKHIINNSGVVWTNTSACKFYGCAYFDNNVNNYLFGEVNWGERDGITIMYWVYFESQPGSSNFNKMYHFDEGDDANDLWTQYSTYCFNPRWEMNGGEFSSNTYSSGCVDSDTWYLITETFNGSHWELRINHDDYTKTVDTTYATLNFGNGEYFEFGSTVDGYMDELAVFNRSLTSDEIEEWFNTTRLGTPPDLDVHVSSISYEIPWIKNATNATVINESQTTMDINFTISNNGINTTTNFSYNVFLNDVNIYNSTAVIGPQSTENVSFPWTTSIGFHTGWIELDVDDAVAEDEETNNNMSLYIPYKNKPWFFDIDCDTTISSSPESQACSTFSSFISEDFNSGWGAADVDPRGKKGFENALTCYNNDGNHESCNRARNHLHGWSSISTSNWRSASVQSTNEIIWISYIVDVMWPYLDVDEAQNWSKNVKNTVVEGTISSTSINLIADPRNVTPKCENGFGGFGAKFGGAAAAMVGLDPDDPMVLYDYDLRYWTEPIPDMYARRLAAFASCSYEDNNVTFYPEMGVYTWYAGTNHMIAADAFLTLGIGDLPDFTYFYEDMAREMLFVILDQLYTGSAIRQDEGRDFRVLQRGDGNSYEDVGSDTIAKEGIFYLLGDVIQDSDLKDAMLYLSDLFHSAGYSGSSPYGMSHYPSLYNNATSQIINNIGNFAYDSKFDDYCVRSNFTFQRDNLFCVFSGDNDDAGHPTSQGYYMYFYGEPFIDFPQVPLNDDVRDEYWQPSILFLNSSGESGYITGCGDAYAYRRYGNAACTITEDENGIWHRVPANLRHNHTAVFGTDDGEYVTSAEFLKYESASDVEQVWVKIDDVILKRVFVNDTPTGLIQDSFINMKDEFNSSVVGENVTIERMYTTYGVEITVPYTNQSLIMHTFDTGKAPCYHKTNPLCGNTTYQKYTLDNTAGQMDLVRAYMPYNNSNPHSVTNVNDVIVVNGASVYFDLDRDGEIAENGWSTDAWAISEVNATHYMATGASYVINNGTILYNDTTGDRTSFIDNYSAEVADTTAPVLTLGANYTTESTIEVNWTTDETSNSTLEVEGVGYFGSDSDVTSHSVTATGLSPSTSHLINLQSCDAANNCGNITNLNISTSASVTSELILDTVSLSGGGALNNLSLSFNTSQETRNATDWRINGTSQAVIHFNFGLNETNNFTDLSTWGHNGHLNGSANWTSERGGGIIFDGDESESFIQVWDTPENSFTDGNQDEPFSTSICFKYNTTAFNAPIASKYPDLTTPVTAEWSMVINTAGELNVQLIDSGATIRVRQNGADILPTQTVLHTGFTYDASAVDEGLIVYLNGYVMNSTGAGQDGTYYAMSPATNAYLSIGAIIDQNPTYEGYLNGTVYDFKLISGNFSAAQMALEAEACLNNYALTTIDSSMVVEGDVWSANVTVFNQTDSLSSLSNNVTISGLSCPDDYVTQAYNLTCTSGSCVFDGSSCAYNNPWNTTISCSAGGGCA